MTFAHPEYFFLLLLLILAIAFYIWKLKKSSATLQIPSTGPFSKLPKSWKEYFRHVNFALILCAYAAIACILARPQSSDSWNTSNVEGIEIVVSLDVSYSMQTEDFKPNRLEAAKDVASNFVNGRPNDNIGMVIFGKESYTLCPMTTDHAALANMINSLKFDLVDGTMTAIGNGLVTAINRIRNGQAKSKVIILLTDGSNNAGDVAPADAAEVAKSLGLRVYTIGVGTDKPFEMTVGYDMFGRPVKETITPDLDENLLQSIARTTGGRYFRATSKDKLSQIFEEIDQMEKTKLNVQEFSKREEEYLPFAMAAIIFLLMHVIFRNTILRQML